MIYDSRIKFVFFGTPELSVEILECLKQYELTPSLVVTNPDKPQGRKMVLTPPPVKVWAQEKGIPFLQPESLSEPDFLYTLNAKRYTLFVVVAYGKIIPKKVLNIPVKGTLNIHYSLLPKYRGASPIESQILNDEQEAGVTIMLMDDKMDHGPIIASEKLKTKSEKPEEVLKASKLRAIMNKVAGELLVKTISRWVAGEIKAREQEHSKATYTKKFTKSDGEIDLLGDGYKNFLKILAFDDSIGTYFFSHKNGRKIRVLVKDAEFKDGKLKFLKVLPEGKKEMSYEEFSRGFTL